MRTPKICINIFPLLPYVSGLGKGRSINLDFQYYIRDVTVIDQDYFHILGMTYIQSEGLAMGVPTSSILSEFYLQYLYKFKILNLLKDNKIEGNFNMSMTYLLFTMTANKHRQPIRSF